MIIIGIDPGSYKTGWGVIEIKGSFLKCVGSGVIECSKNQKLSDRLEKIFHGVSDAVKQFQPEEGAVEEVFFSKNANSALVLGQARGAALLALKQGNIKRIFQYSPRKIKMSVVGTGGAEKRQVQHMVKIILAKRDAFSSEDESDALASAICHANNMGRAAKEI